MRIFITGTAGFIGFHLARRLLAQGHLVDGFDGMTTYYDVSLKEARRGLLLPSNAYRDTIGMLEDFKSLSQAVAQAAPDVIIHLAAQAGVRPGSATAGRLDVMNKRLELIRAKP